MNFSCHACNEYLEPYVPKRALKQNCICHNNAKKIKIDKKDGLSRDLNPGPPAPKAGIIPLDH